MEQKDVRQLASNVEAEYKDGLQYKKSMGLLSKWATHERFKAGDQWPTPTKKTKDLPRPVFNIIKQIINHKVASVMNENIRMVFSSNDITDEGSPEVEGAAKYTRFSDSTWESIKQDQLNEEALESAATTGLAIWHYFFDPTVTGGNVTQYIGDIKGEVIDAVNFFPADPQNTFVQDQQYIIITYRDSVKNVRKLAKNNGVSEENIALIRGDKDTSDQSYDMAKVEMNNKEKVTVLTKYWKENGTVHFMKVASGVVAQPDTDTGMKLYPIAIMQWERRKKSIFGTSDVEGLIPNQKSINFLMAMQLLSIQNTGWPKLLVDKNLVRQQITNAPGEVINVNGSQGNIGNSVQYMNPAPMTNQAASLVEAFLSYTKEINGANESSIGEHSAGQPNATAIMLLQKASGVPLESIKRRFYQAVEDIGHIWSEFWKVYFNTTRIIHTKDEDGESQTEDFNGSEYADVDMNLKISVGPSSSYSESLMMTSLDKLYDRQAISLEDYLMFVPENVVPFKDRLLKRIQEREQQQQLMQQQQQQMAAMQQQEMAAMQQPEDDTHEFDKFLATLPKHQQANFKKMPPEQQQAIMEQVMAADREEREQQPTV